MDRPNPDQTWAELWAQKDELLRTCGICYLWIVPNPAWPTSTKLDVPAEARLLPGPWVTTRFCVEDGLGKAVYMVRRPEQPTIELPLEALACYRGSGGFPTGDRKAQDQLLKAWAAKEQGKSPT